MDWSRNASRLEDYCGKFYSNQFLVVCHLGSKGTHIQGSHFGSMHTLHIRKQESGKFSCSMFVALASITKQD